MGVDDDHHFLSTTKTQQAMLQLLLAAGADSLAGDKLGAFNLSMKGHASCLEFIKSFGLPMLVLGGGGYRISNVSRCWAYETGVILGTYFTGVT